MGGRDVGRWVDDRLHYYDYNLDTVLREPTRDAYVLAEAFIYDANSIERVAIRVMVAGRDVHIGGVKLTDAIRRGRTVRDEAVTKHRGQLPAAGHRAVLYDLHGHEVEQHETPR